MPCGAGWVTVQPTPAPQTRSRYWGSYSPWEDRTDGRVLSSPTYLPYVQSGCTLWLFACRKSQILEQTVLKLEFLLEEFKQTASSRGMAMTISLMNKPAIKDPVYL